MRGAAHVELHADLFTGDVVAIVPEALSGASSHQEGWDVDDVAAIALAIETPAGPSHAILSADAPSNHAFLTRSVGCVSVAAALAGARLKRVEGARGVQVAAPHLQLHFAQSGRVSAIGALKNNASEAQVLANERRALACTQRSGDATPHRGRHARSALVNHHSGHNSLWAREKKVGGVCVCVCEGIYLCCRHFSTQMNAQLEAVTRALASAAERRRWSTPRWGTSTNLSQAS